MKNRTPAPAFIFFTPLFALLLLTGISPSTLAAKNTLVQSKIAILHDQQRSTDSQSIDLIKKELTAEGFSVKTLNYDEITDQNRFNHELYDIIILTSAPYFPTPAHENLRQFLRLGGNLVTLGGDAFSIPLCKIGTDWLSEEEFINKVEKTKAFSIPLKFRTDAAGTKNRSSSDFSNGSTIREKKDPKNSLLSEFQMDIRQLQRFHHELFTFDLPSSIQSNDLNSLLFNAKGSLKSPFMTVIAQDINEDRWKATIPLTSDWKTVLLTAAKFKPEFPDRPMKSANPQFKVNRLTKISFGAAKGDLQSEDDFLISIKNLRVAQLNIPDTLDFKAKIGLNIFEHYPSYYYRNAQTITNHDLLDANVPIEIKGSYRGISALGVALKDKSRFIPLLSLFDSYQRHLGWGAGVLANFSGDYKNSQWLLWGIENHEFYQTQEFITLLKTALLKISNREWITIAQKETEAEKSYTLPLVTSAPKGFIRLSEDKKHFITPDGKPFFMIGINYVGYEDALTVTPTIANLERDFAIAHQAGVNAMRILIAYDPLDIQTATALRELARKYAIYLYFDLRAYDKREGKIWSQKVKEIAAYWKDEPMLLGYDLGNEPYFTQLGSTEFKSGIAPILKLNPYVKYAGHFNKEYIDKLAAEKKEWPEPFKWATYEEAQNLYAAHQLYVEKILKPMGVKHYSPFTGQIALIPLEGEWKELAQAINGTFGAWIDDLSEAIRSEDKNHFISVGYNTPAVRFRTNQKLDFQSTHIYQFPNHRKDITLGIETMDKTQQLWPNKPMTYGEFGCSNGYRIGRDPINPHTSSLVEMIYLLHAYQKGFSGAMKWQLNDVPYWMLVDTAVWWKNDEVRLNEGQFGMTYHVGSTRRKLKPIGHAMRFLSDSIQMDSSLGKLELFDSESIPTKTSYLYRGDRKLFIGNTDYQSPELSFETHDKNQPNNMMLRWNQKSLTLMSTADAHAKINLDAFLKGDPTKITVTGKCASFKRRSSILKINLLEGEVITIQY